MMIDLQLKNQKLVERSKKIIMLATDVDYAEAEKYLEMSGNHVKTAIFLALTGETPENARAYISRNEGHLKPALHEWRASKN
jgi:N-acetylmuramic acid 6-phosphate etherase